MFGRWLLFLLVVFLLGIVATLVQGQSSNSTRKNCNRKKVDACSNRLTMLGDPTFVFPETLEQMNKRCKEIKPLEKCLKDYTTKCLPKSSSSTISVLAYGISKTNKGYCSNVRRKMAFVAMGKCGNQNKRFLEKLMDRLSFDIQSTIDYKIPKLRIPLACCAYFKFKSSMNDLVLEKCKEHEAESSAMVEGFAHDILNLVCGDYTEESNKCESIIGELPANNAKVQSLQLHSKSFIHPLAALFESL